MATMLRACTSVFLISFIQGTCNVLASVQAAPPNPLPYAVYNDSMNGSSCSDISGVINATNTYRAWHQSPPLAWDPSLAADAQAYADELAAKQCELEHAAVGGECLYSVVTYPKPDWSCRRAVDAWYSEMKLYDFTAGNPYDYNIPRGTGHFVQLVWRSSAVFGCGVGKADVPMSRMPGGYGGCKIVVCRYRTGFKANNLEFQENAVVLFVTRRKAHARLHVQRRPTYCNHAY
ncbi:hypothetical protein VOLCADRAFT_118015 [Volvox carteri f. nagariensis]|uniref:SCP domain-containing protein n=1 Tax=Volvox carteri f. nagariensis TaxID=3068 RepID=D8U098_VOLCA|nr:uncharacterized protein VOLCADRAFT_118015 [Volvox carteri f. nagariensis]EFJ46904.1 hypothetical protein VOLCADRAFT_118015 [Volvox carteri f. nagariensis]|eukprot:XP_002952113.1 hypothetical protein VOLCADRAFT_118015 [Volvox carteri f. nagariensis]